MNDAFPDANIIHYKHKIRELDLPDQEDRHVLAAAIIANAQLIVTFNVRDFPTDIVDKFGIRSIHPDLFIFELIQQNERSCFNALRIQKKSTEISSEKH
jgi:predicted nucleic acid-binding protein